MNIENFVPIAAYQQSRENVFPTLPSLRWFMRSRIDDLVTKGVMIRVANRKMLNIEAMDEYVLRVGQEEARA